MKYHTAVQQKILIKARLRSVGEQKVIQWKNSALDFKLAQFQLTLHLESSFIMEGTERGLKEILGHCFKFSPQTVEFNLMLNALIYISKLDKANEFCLPINIRHNPNRYRKSSTHLPRLPNGKHKT